MVGKFEDKFKLPFQRYKLNVDVYIVLLLYYNYNIR